MSGSVIARVTAEITPGTKIAISNQFIEVKPQSPKAVLDRSVGSVAAV